MPELCRFYGIVIKMYYADHAPPHFHAEYAEDEIRVAIDTLSVISGKLTPRATGMVVEWAALHQAELRARWQSAMKHERLPKIDPLP